MAAVCGLATWSLVGAARADDVTVKPGAGSGFVVTDNTGATQRFKVVESGPIYLGGLVGSPATENQALCYDTATGQVGPCPSAKNLGFCVPNPAASPRFVDNMDGTVTDLKTCLMWEKKTGTITMSVDCSTTTCSDPHDVNNRYKWSATGTAPDGGAFTDFLPQVNGLLCSSTSCAGLGGHSDWRLPTIAELQTILLAPYPCGTTPCIDAIFGPTQLDNYWSATTYFSTAAWGVLFDTGFVNDTTKLFTDYVRAVRGGL